jgi:hypothetical protein
MDDVVAERPSGIALIRNGTSVCIRPVMMETDRPGVNFLAVFKMSVTFTDITVKGSSVTQVLDQS